MGKIRLVQVKSKIRRPKNQKATLEALGLRKMNQVVEHDFSRGPWWPEKPFPLGGL